MVEYNINYNCVILMRYNKKKLLSSTTNQKRHSGFSYILFNELKSVPISAIQLL